MQHIGFRYYEHLNHELIEYVLDGIYEGLFETKEWKRKQFKIYIHTKDKDAEGAKQLILKIKKVIDLLDGSKIEDWMFLWDIEGFKHKNFDKQLILKELRDIFINQHKIVVDEYGFAISNEGCKINGYSVW